MITTKEKKSWIKELKSGKWEQTFHTLKKTGSKGQPQYCVLGVAKHVCGISLYSIPMDKQERLIDLNDDNQRSFKFFGYYINRYL